MEEDFKWDKWQEDVLTFEGNITIRAGRQVGKTSVIAAKAANFAEKYPNTVTLVIAAAQRQSSLLFEKIRAEIDKKVEMKILDYKEEPTLTKIYLSNGSKIYSLPAGRTGYFIRGFSVDLLIADEAAFIPEEVWTSVMPMIAVSRKTRGMGWIILLSTPFGKGGYYYSTFFDRDFRKYHISSEECKRIPREFLDKERNRLTKAEYAQEYLGEFIDEHNQYFRTSLIKERMNFFTWDFVKDYRTKYRYYLGVDIARYGGDENAFVVAEVGVKIRIVRVITTQNKSLTDTIGRILSLHERFKFRKIFIDDAGVGGGVFDVLSEKLSRKVVGLNNAKRSIDAEGNNRALLKEDMYSNALLLMERGEVDLVNDLGLMKSLQGMTFEYTSERNLKIKGKYSHICEAFVRACWCNKDKGLKLFIS